MNKKHFFPTHGSLKFADTVKISVSFTMREFELLDISVLHSAI